MKEQSFWTFLLYDNVNSSKNYNVIVKLGVFQTRGAIWRKSIPWSWTLFWIKTITCVRVYWFKGRLFIWLSLNLLCFEVLTEWFCRSSRSKTRFTLSFFVFSLFSKTIGTRMVGLMIVISVFQYFQNWGLLLPFVSYFCVKLTAGFGSQITGYNIWRACLIFTFILSSGNSRVRTSSFLMSSATTILYNLWGREGRL